MERLAKNGITSVPLLMKQVDNLTWLGLNKIEAIKKEFGSDEGTCIGRKNRKRKQKRWVASGDSNSKSQPDPPQTPRKTHPVIEIVSDNETCVYFSKY